MHARPTVSHVSKNQWNTVTTHEHLMDQRLQHLPPRLGTDPQLVKADVASQNIDVTALRSKLLDHPVLYNDVRPRRIAPKQACMDGVDFPLVLTSALCMRVARWIRGVEVV